MLYFLLALLQPTAAPGHAASPIHINSCDVKKLHTQYGLGDLFIKGKGYNFFNVTFTNTSKETVKHVVFQIEFEKSRYVVNDAGSFAPEQQVTHHLRDHGKDVQAHARTGTGPTECSVLSAKFADGTSWSAPEVP
jgi:hypothetical protein